MIKLLSVYNIGETIASNIYEYFRNDYNLTQINKLFENGVKIESNANLRTFDTIFDNKLVVLTGTLEKYSRLEATELLEKFNAQVTSSVSKNTNYVIAGENSGSKVVKAESLGIKIINENEFYEIIKRFE